LCELQEYQSGLEDLEESTLGHTQSRMVAAWRVLLDADVVGIIRLLVLEIVLGVVPVLGRLVLGRLLVGRLLVVAVVLASLRPGLVEAAVVVAMPVLVRLALVRLVVALVAPVPRVPGLLVQVHPLVVEVVMTMYWMSSMSSVYDEVEGTRL